MLDAGCHGLLAARIVRCYGTNLAPGRVGRDQVIVTSVAARRVIVELPPFLEGGGDGTGLTLG
jgi:hypothetical protein